MVGSLRPRCTMTVLSGMMVRDVEVGHASYQEHLETYLGSVAMLRATGSSFGCENRNRTSRHTVPEAGLRYRGASCRTGPSCHIVTCEDPIDTNVHAITRMGCKWPSKDSSPRPVPCPGKCIYPAHWHTSKGSLWPQH